ncbi:MAG TPA: SusC/RagA family TonB-linked outer membrane protein [Cyclobacteriaceae bacterium]|nr:SusC/RagA family TonB-linked outer membrane protein [Cyclobacteriaceae bacterium]
MKKRLLRLTVLLLLISLVSYAQDKTISGTVKAKDGSAMPGVNILLKGTATGTTSDADGAYHLIVPSSQSVLVFTFIGHTSQEIVVGDQTTINVTLVEDATQLGEVVVTALGLEKNIRSLGYSTTEVNGSNFTQSREINLGNALTGQVAGVSVSGLATGPAGSSRVTIRGNASMTGNNQPLYVIDGIPFDNTNQGTSGQWGGADYGDGLSSISPDNIESIQVLKGVAASALYGYRGANGAILITTKSGSKSKGIGLEVNNNLTFNSFVDEHNYQYKYGQGTQGIKPTTQAAALGTSTLSWGPKLDGTDAVNFLGDTYKYSAQKNNFKNFFRTGVSNQSSIAVTNSGEFGSFRLGITDLHMKMPIPNSSMTQQGLNLNATMNVTKKLQAIVTANYMFEKVTNRASLSDSPGNVLAVPNLISNSFDIRWLKPAVKADGSELLPGTDIYTENPYFVAYKYQNETRRNRLTASFKLKYDINDWLYVSSMVSRDGYIFDQTAITPTNTSYNLNGAMTQFKTDFHELNGNVMIGMNKKFGDFSLSANIGANSQDNINQKAGVDNVGGFVIPYFYSTSNVATRPFTYTYTHYRVNSNFVSADLGYKNWLYLTLTARKDWFSTLNINKDTYTYPSASTSFVFSEALHLPSFISFGKLRASYGMSSNGTLPYRNLLTYGLQGYSINSQTLGYITQTDIPNKNLGPVKIAESEVGMNLQFLENRVGLDVAVYNKQTTDDIVKASVSSGSGFDGLIANVGKVRNRGIEILLTGSPVKRENFSWDVSFNYANNDSKILTITKDSKSLVADGGYPRWGDGTTIQQVEGKRFAQIVGYAYKRDASGQKIIGADGMPLRTDTQVPLGSGVYKITGGLTNTFTYKGIRLSFLIDYKFGAKIYSSTNLLLYANGLHKETLKGREEGVIAKGVTEGGQENTKSVNAQVYYSNLTLNNYVAEEFVYDASFIKLRSLSLGYSLPKSILGNGFVKGVALSVVTRNLAILMKHVPNVDPESNLTNSNAQGLELSGYPITRSIGFNLNLKF